MNKYLVSTSIGMNTYRRLISSENMKTAVQLFYLSLMSIILMNSENIDSVYDLSFHARMVQNEDGQLVTTSPLYEYMLDMSTSDFEQVQKI